MTFTTAVFLSVLFLLVAAILGGLIVYFMMNNSIKKLREELNSLQKKYNSLQTNCEQKQKELQLEIDARDKKMLYMKEDQDKLQTSFEVRQSELKFEADAANAKANTLKADYDTLKLQCEHDKGELKAQVAEKNTQIVSYTKKINDLEAKISALAVAPVLEVKEKKKEKKEDKKEDKKKDKKEDKKKDKKEEKKEKELAKVKEKAKTFDYSNMGTAVADARDDLKLIVGIGPFIEEKLNALRIYTFLQISKFNDNDIEKVTEAIEFFPGRIQRDEWIKQAKEFVAEKKP